MAGIDIDFENVSSDPEDLEKVFAQLEAGETPAPSVPTPVPVDEVSAGAKTDSDPVDQDKQKAVEQGQTLTEAEPQGVATKDGKHVIPYSVLKGERDRASRAEQLATEMKDRVTALEALVKSGNQEAKPGDSARTNPAPTDTDLSQEDLQALKEDFPTVYKAVMASMASAKTLEAKLAPVEDSVRQDAAQRAQTANESVQDAIDAVPKMAHIQANDANAFELAKQFDTTLRSQAAWADRPLSERFQKVTDMVEAALGAIDLPGTKPASLPSAQELKTAAVAQAALAAKTTRTNVPTSLSEFPVGQHVAQDEREAAEGLSTLQLAEKFSAMSADQMDAYFQNL